MNETFYMKTNFSKFMYYDLALTVWVGYLFIKTQFSLFYVYLLTKKKGVELSWMGWDSM